MAFYCTPKYLFNPIAERGICTGKVVLPLHPHDELESQIRQAGINDIIVAPDEQSFLDQEWWKSLPAYDWTVAVTQGIGKTLDWVIEPGYQMANKGLIMLDRITFLEPTRNREDFLLDKPLTNLIVLNPRPEFRADQNKSKDSVTSAWYVFRKDVNPNQGTNVEYAVSWQRPKLLNLQ